MTEIERLALTLPAGFAPRAARLARLTARVLAAQPLPQGTVLPSVHPAPLRLDPRRSDAALAGAIARHIAAGITQAAADGSPSC
ncbi:MAG: hypothetical protein KF788_17980 [Piscinibacter sp.]|nr:hypothetical protein [Piscinibacter sp.]